MERFPRLLICSLIVISRLLTSGAAEAVCDSNITAGPTTPTASTSANFYFTSSGCSHGSYTCKLDGGSYASCTSPKAYAGLSDGQHTFYVKYTGELSPATWTWTIDVTSPQTTMVTAPPSFTNDPRPTLSFSSNEAGTFECKVDSGSYAVCTSPFTTSKLASGAHTVLVRAKDLASNYDATPAESNFTVGRSTTAQMRGMWIRGDTRNELWGRTALNSPVRILHLNTANVAHTVDRGGENYWILASDNTLSSYTFEGIEQLSVVVPSTPGGGDVVSLGSDVYDGSVRLAFATSLYHYSMGGSLNRTTTLPSAAKALAIDARLGQTVVVLANSIVAIGRSSGNTVFSISQSGGTAIDLDPYTGEFWVLFPGNIRLYSSAGTELASTTLSGGTSIGIDGLGGAWVGAGVNLYQYDVDAIQRQSLTPFGASSISTLTTDPFSGEVWAAFSTTASHYSFGGSLVEKISSTGTIRNITLATDVTAATGAFNGKDTHGVRLAAGSTAWEINKVWAGSPAATAGLLVGDDVISINNVSAPSLTATVAQFRTFLASVRAARVGTTDDFEIYRGSSMAFAVSVQNHAVALRNGFYVSWTVANTNVDPEPEACKQCFATATGNGAQDMQLSYSCKDADAGVCDLGEGGNGCTPGETVDPCDQGTTDTDNAP